MSTTPIYDALCQETGIVAVPWTSSIYTDFLRSILRPQPALWDPYGIDVIASPYMPRNTVLIASAAFK